VTFGVYVILFNLILVLILFIGYTFVSAEPVVLCICRMVVVVIVIHCFMHYLLSFYIYEILFRNVLQPIRLLRSLCKQRLILAVFIIG
jgi:hypothetical protein